MMIFLIIGFSSFILTYIVRYYAINKSILDIPNGRSSHSIPTPRGGGLAIAISWFIGLIYFFATGIIVNSLFWALILGLPLAIIGFLDDIFSLKPKTRFLVQFICAGASLCFLGGLKSVTLGSLNVNHIWLLTPLSFIAIIWSINLFNFLDGIDGYIGSEVVFIGLAVFTISGDYVGLLLAAATFGFLIWNWPKAKIFMGDVGSTFLGFTVAILAIYHQKNSISSVWVWMILTSVFWLDATITLLRRFINKEKLSEAHRKHAYQRAVQSGFSHRQVTLGLILINLFGLGLAWIAHLYCNYGFFVMLIDIMLVFIVIKYIDKRKPFEYRIIRKS